MMTGFKRRFEHFVEDGSKEHTMRDIRRGTRQIRVGDRLDCYRNVRQKSMSLIGRWRCIRVQVACFFWTSGQYFMTIDGVALSPDEADAFAWRDGFRHPGVPHFEATHADNCYSAKTSGCFRMMMEYWQAEGKKFPFAKQLLHWKYSDRLPDELPKKPKRPRGRPRG